MSMQEQARRKSGAAWMHLFVALLITPFSGLGLFWALSYGIAQVDEGWHPAWFGNSSNAQVLVLKPDSSADGFSAELEPVSFLASYKGMNPGCTFLIPVDRKERVQEQLKSQGKVAWSTVEIKSLPAGQEEITLSFMDRVDDSYGSRYIAGKDGAQLESYRYAGDRDGIGIILFAMLLAFVSHVLVLGGLLVRGIYWWRRSRRGDLLAVG